MTAGDGAPQRPRPIPFHRGAAASLGLGVGSWLLGLALAAGWPIGSGGVPPIEPRTWTHAAAAFADRFLPGHHHQAIPVAMGLPAALGIVVGLMGYRRVREGRRGLRGARAAKVGVYLSVLALPASLLLAEIPCSRRIAAERQCRQNMRHLAEAVFIWVQRNDGLCPPRGVGLQKVLGRHAAGENVFCCPLGRHSPSYWFNPQLRGRSLHRLPDPGRTVLLFESDDGLVPSIRHGAWHCAFADGRVVWVNRSREGEVIWNPWRGRAGLPGSPGRRR